MSTVNIKVAIDDIFAAIKAGTLKPEGNTVKATDDFITYTSKTNTIDPSTTPPTITLVTNDTVDFEIEPENYNGEEVDFDYFDDPYLTAKPDNVAKHIDRYETADTASICKDITMKIHVSHDNAAWEINWDPTIIVGDPKK